LFERARRFVEEDDPQLGDPGTADEEALGFAAGKRVG
jgi:hypothetical protein